MTPNPPRVLIVEDAPSIRRLMGSYLTQLGLAVDEASDGEQAITRLMAEPPALVCLDLMLPKFSGYQVCQFIRKQPHLQQVPILVISARTLPLDRAHAEEAGASAYLTKPFTRAAFNQQVLALLQAASPTSALP